MLETSEFDFSFLGVDIDLKSSTNVRIWLVLSGKNTKNFKTAPSFDIFTKGFFLLQISWMGVARTYLRSESYDVKFSDLSIYDVFRAIGEL